MSGNPPASTVVIEEVSDSDSDYSEAEVLSPPGADEEKEDVGPKTPEDFKGKGNEYYMTGKYTEALDAYRAGIELVGEDDNKLKSVLYANMGAVYAAQGDHPNTIAQCTVALDLNKDYHKARRRRALAYDATDDSKNALEDWKVVLEADSSDKVARKRVSLLEEVVRKQQEKEQAEMMAKLKDMGNSLLGKFGLSLDNFQTTQDPSTGGYSVQFKQGGSGGAAATQGGRSPGEGGKSPPSQPPPST